MCVGGCVREEDVHPQTTMNIHTHSTSCSASSPRLTQRGPHNTYNTILINLRSQRELCISSNVALLPAVKSRRRKSNADCSSGAEERDDGLPSTEGTYMSADVTMRPRLMTWCASCHERTHEQKQVREDMASSGRRVHSQSAAAYNLCYHVQADTSC